MGLTETHKEKTDSYGKSVQNPKLVKDKSGKQRKDVSVTLDLSDKSEKTAENNNIRYFELGGHETEEKKFDELKLKKIIGGVNATKFRKIERNQKFHQDNIDAAKEISAYYKLLDNSSQQWFDNLKLAIEDLAKIDTFDDEKWQKFKTTHENEIYEKDGLFNFLLA